MQTKIYALFSILCAMLFVVISMLNSCKQEATNDSSPSIEPSPQHESEPLPSWNEGETKQAIVNYVQSVTETGSADFIPVSDRIATFDNDGTLWSEQPAYFQLFFALDRIKEMAPDHPEWKDEEPFRSVLDNDLEGLSKQGLEGLMKVVMVSHGGMESEEFKTQVREWASTAMHPTKKKLYKDLVYQPMLELLDYLKQNDFKVYIVSGGGTDFMRAFVTEIYGIPTERIIGSRISTEFKIENGKPGIYRLPELEFMDDKEGKPLNFELYVHHTDSIREWAYDRESHIGKLDKGLDEAAQKGWTVIDMPKDWKVIYPFELGN